MTQIGEQLDTGDEEVGPPRKVRRVILISAVTIALLVALFIGVLATRKPAVERLAETPLQNHAAPDLVGTTIDGQKFRLSDLRGKFVVVNFFASWCAPCRQEHPELIRFSQRHTAEDDAVVVSVIFDDSVKDVRAFFAKNGGDWPVVNDPGSDFSVDWGVRAPPESFIVDPYGFVRTRIVGQSTADGLDRILREIEAKD